MKSSPKIGTVGEETFVVGQQHLIDFADEVMPAVLSTPSLIWFMEYAAMNALRPLLDTGEKCVGASVNVDHIAPTLVGARVVCRAKVIFVDHTVISFQIEAHDEHEPIARGTHKRRVIDAARLARRVAKKVK